MGLLGALLKTTIHVATTPLDVVSDICTLGGAITDTESAMERKARKLSDDIEELEEDVCDL